MEYSIRELSQMAGVSARTLRYYDQIGLLKPLFTNEAGYRYYGPREVELLQQILFYRERDINLKSIYDILYNKDFNVSAALEEHLAELEKKQLKINQLITTINHTLASMKGEYEMNDKERFAAFKLNAVSKNEELHGDEIRTKYGDEEVDLANKKLLDMTEEEYKRFQSLELEIKTRLKAAVTAGFAIDSEEAKEIVKLHQDWLCMTWPKYTAQAHKGMGAMYTSDQRFQQYYDKEIAGCAEFLNQAICRWV